MMYIINAIAKLDMQQLSMGLGGGISQVLRFTSTAKKASYELAAI